MEPNEASESSPSKGESPKLTLALTFGFAAGALLARKPAAAITAVAAGLMTCLRAGRRREVENLKDDRPKPNTTPVACHLTTVETSEELEPLPAIAEAEARHESPASTEPLAISLPEITQLALTEEPRTELSPQTDLDLHAELMREIEAAITRP